MDIKPTHMLVCVTKGNFSVYSNLEFLFHKILLWILCTIYAYYSEFFFQGLRDCCRSIRIGKILVESDADTHEARVVYARFPEDISDRKVLLMYPIMSKFTRV